MIKHEIVYVQTNGNKRKRVRICQFKTELEAQECIKMIKGIIRNRELKKQVNLTESKKHEWDVKDIYQLKGIFYKNVNFLPYLFILDTGIRAGELCALTWSDVDLKTGRVIINKTVTRHREFKWGVSNSRTRRVIKLPENLNEVLSLYKDRLNHPPREEYIFANINGDFLLPDLLSRKLKLLLEHTEVTKDISVNDLRKMYKFSNGLL